jgi:Uma2 family endonuclease
MIYSARAAIWVDDDTYLEPDLMYISHELKGQMSADHWTRADIVIEVSSPSTVLYDHRTKSDTYRAMGVRELWLVDATAKEIEVRSFEAGRTTVYRSTDILRSAVLSAIELIVAAVFS